MTKDFLGDDKIETIYLGGGTPSLLTAQELEKIFLALSKEYEWDHHCEVTLEANPEDINPYYLSDLKSVGINRLSIGIQSFSQNDLHLMNRVHSALQSERALGWVNESEFDNYSVDLMFGLVNTTISDWQDNLEKAMSYDPPHISAYNLTIEEQTAFSKWVSQGKIKTPQEDVQFEQFKLAHDMLCSKGYDHYEISNYCQEGFIADHNTNYWKNKPYLGIGPAAHSYNGSMRRWNIANNSKYIKAILSESEAFESEILSSKDKYNEMIMLSLRTKWGVTKESIRGLDSETQNYFRANVEGLINKNLIRESTHSYYLTLDHWYMSDEISSQLFIV